VEVVALMVETLDALFDMELPVGEGPLAALLRGIGAAFDKWVVVVTCTCQVHERGF
jgi:hypothetical protein